MSDSRFEVLVGDAEAAAIDGWSFDWLDGRATEERPPWGFAKVLADRLGTTPSVLDLQTGGGEFLAEVLDRATHLPARVAATEAWHPNMVLARRQLARFNAQVSEVANTAALPFEANSFDLVTSRHPVTIRWDEVARVLRRGASYLAQHVGPASNREIADFLMGPQPVSDVRSAERTVRNAAASGLKLVRLEEAKLRVEFYDIGALVYFLRLVPWTVPEFTVSSYEEPLRRVHDIIEAEGRFTSHSTRFLIDLRNT